MIPRLVCCVIQLPEIFRMVYIKLNVKCKINSLRDYWELYFAGSVIVCKHNKKKICKKRPSMLDNILQSKLKRKNKRAFDFVWLWQYLEYNNRISKITKIENLNILNFWSTKYLPNFIKIYFKICCRTTTVSIWVERVKKIIKRRK